MAVNNPPIFDVPEAAALRIDAVEFHWPGKHRFQLLIESFAVKRGERVLILGPSGAGKSTLLSLICGIVTPQAGAIGVLAKDLVAMAPAERDRFRAEHIGVIFQMFNLLPYASALDNVLLPLSFAPVRQQRASSSGSAKEEAARLLAALGLDESQTSVRRAAELSAGQQQRVAAARALIGSPEMIVADEPTSALDAAVQDTFLDLLFSQAKEVKAALLMVSHDERLSGHFDRTVPLSDFAAVRQGGHA